MNITDHVLILSVDSDTEFTNEIKLIYRGNENIRIESKNDKDDIYILVPRFELQKFMEMIKGS